MDFPVAAGRTHVHARFGATSALGAEFALELIQPSSSIIVWHKELDWYRGEEVTLTVVAATGPATLRFVTRPRGTDAIAATYWTDIRLRSE
jgi:hypothetical protein